MSWDGGDRRSKQREVEDMQKRVMKEAIKEWLDDQFTKVGKWTAAGFAALLLSALVYLILLANGWHPK